MNPVGLPILLFVIASAGLTLGLLWAGKIIGPKRASRVKEMPYESGMDPIHDTRRRFDVRFHLIAIAFLLFDVELLFLYPWAVASRASGAPLAARQADDVIPAPAGIDAAVAGGLVESRGLVFGGVLVFLLLVTLGFVYDWRKGIFRWR